MGKPNNNTDQIHCKSFNKSLTIILSVDKKNPTPWKKRKK